MILSSIDAVFVRDGDSLWIVWITGMMKTTPLIESYDIEIEWESVDVFRVVNLGWVQTNPLVFWYQWDCLRSPAKNCHLLLAI